MDVLLSDICGVSGRSFDPWSLSVDLQTVLLLLLQKEEGGSTEEEKREKRKLIFSVELKFEQKSFHSIIITFHSTLKLSSKASNAVLSNQNLLICFDKIKAISLSQLFLLLTLESCCLSFGDFDASSVTSRFDHYQT